MYICWKDQREILHTVDEMEKEERDYMKSFDSPFIAFADRVQDIKEKVTSFINEEYSKGKAISVMGASTKGNTLLQYFDITDKQIIYAAEVNKDKFGKKTVATNIPIISESAAVAMKPDYFLVLPWHFIDMLLKIHDKYLKNGGRIVVPMPEPAVYLYENHKLVKRLL